MKKLNVTKERFEKSRYFKNKYGKLAYVSESGDIYKTDKGKVLMFVKEDTGNEGSSVGITCKIALKGNSPEEVIQNLHERLLNLDAAITDGNENPNLEMVEKYSYWDKENEGDTMFPLYKDDEVYCEIYNARTYSSGI